MQYACHPAVLSHGAAGVACRTGKGRRGTPSLPGLGIVPITGRV